MTDNRSAQTGTGVRVFASLVIASAFVALFVIAAIEVLGAAKAADLEGSFTTREAYTYIATALTGLVGAVAAFRAGVSAAKPPNPVTRMNALSITLGSVVGARKPDWQKLLGQAYLWIYLLVAVAAAAIWLIKGAVTTDVIKNHATVGLTLLLGIVQPWLGSAD